MVWYMVSVDLYSAIVTKVSNALGFGDRSTERGTFGDEFGAPHCNQWGLYGVRVRQCRDAALFPNYFGQTWWCGSGEIQA